MSDVNPWLVCFLAAGGVIFHFVSKLYELEQQGVVVAPWQYWRQYPYASLIVVLGTIGMLLLQYVMNELTYTGAILTGVAGNSLGDKLRAFAGSRLPKTTP